ncbi:MAG: thioredoxin domain-containing protein [Janthinobacterium lividum]
MSRRHRFTAAALIALTAASAPAAIAAAPAAHPKPAAVNWLDVVVATPEGGFRQGNPNAKVKLLEFGALTCPHCAAFAREGVPALRAKYIATGRVSYEYRAFLLNGVDLAPALLVLCQPPAAAIKLIETLYDQQQLWIEPFRKPVPDDVQKKMATLPPEQQITAFAANGGLDSFMRTRGVTRAEFDTCTSDKFGIAKLNGIRKDANDNFGLTSVPTFAINGKTVHGTSTWTQLQPAIDAAL